MDEHDVLAGQFEAYRPRLRAIAYQTLGSASEADDAVQEAWLRLSRSGPGGIENLGGWLTTVVARVCLHTLAPAERLAFVLHDMFAVPFGDIAAIVGRSPAAARQLASRARRRVQGPAPVLGADLTRQRAVAGAFLAAARHGDFGALLEVLDPDVVVRSNGAEISLRGAAAVAGRALAGLRSAQVTLPALINGAVGAVNAVPRRPISLMTFTISGAKIVAIDLIDDPARIAEADLAILGR